MSKVNTKTVNQTREILRRILKEHIVLSTHHPELVKRYHTIYDVGFYEIFDIYAALPDDKKLLCLPGEIDNENITIIYSPSEGLTIAIESEPCVDFSWKAKQVKFEYFHLN